MRRCKRLVLMGVFSIGLLYVCPLSSWDYYLLTVSSLKTCVVRAIRILTLSSMYLTDITYSIPQANIFSGLEPSVAIRLACIPLLRPLLGCTKGSSDGTFRYGAATPAVKAMELKSKDGGALVPLAT
ncbi:hypothetical protein BR93DRAFT_930278 [Coniochaeta sp. PMI_546]|nr:hypothetical protein BR93DRAFT_930278 [Coniochaeta sp. PMI_546]